MIFKIHQTNTCIVYQRALVILMFVIVGTYNVFGQEDEYSERDYGTFVTPRNDPYPHTNLDTTIVHCRKLVKLDSVFYPEPNVHDISHLLQKSFEELTFQDKDDIITYAWHNNDTTLLSIVSQVALFDTDHGYLRKYSIQCLSRFNTDAVKKVLTSLLKDKEVGLISALSLVQLGQNELAFQYIQSYYTESVEYEIIPGIVTALMKINTPDAIKLLMKISEHKDPSEALDALGALSLLGYCDYSFKGFCKYKTNEEWLVRSMVANCLLYYTGSPEAIEIVKNMYYKEEDNFAVGWLEGILIKYNPLCD